MASSRGALSRRSQTEDDDEALDVDEVSVSRPPPHPPLRFVVHTSHDAGDRVHRLRFGLPGGRLQQACVYFVVPDDGRKPMQLEWVGHDDKCSDPDLPDRGGTKVMLEAALRLLRMHFPGRRNGEVRFSDSSKLLRCYPEPPHAPRDLEAIRTSMHPRAPGAAPEPVSLAYQSVLLYGSTWYQRHFGAFPLDLQYAEEHEERPADALARVARELARPPEGAGDERAFRGWFERYVGVAHDAGRPHMRWLRSARVVDALRAAWMRPPASWNAFFREANDALGCAVFGVLNDTFARRRLRLDMNRWEWAIPPPPPAQTQTQTQAGGSALAASRAARRRAVAFFRAADRAREAERAVYEGWML